MEGIISRDARELLGDTGRRCRAKCKETGEQCRRAPIMGGFVCPMHGGKVPAVMKTARERLLAMCDPALDALFRVLRSHGAPCEHCGRSDGDRDPNVIRAAQIVLDRCGFSPTMKIEVSTPDAFADLSLAELADQAEQIARDARGAADDEAQLRLGDGFTIDAVVIREDQ